MVRVGAVLLAFGGATAVIGIFRFVPVAKRLAVT